MFSHDFAKDRLLTEFGETNRSNRLLINDNNWYRKVKGVYSPKVE